MIPFNQVSYIESLKAIKRKLEGQLLSVLVGAGFSKNVDPDLFPSWWELLTKMVKSTRDKLIEEEYELLKAATPATSIIEPYEKFLKRKIEQYINRVGPL